MSIIVVIDELAVPVLIAPELVLQVLCVTSLISKRGLALQPVDDITINSYWDLQLEIRCLIVPSPTQTVLVYGNVVYTHMQLVSLERSKRRN